MLSTLNWQVCMAWSCSIVSLISWPELRAQPVGRPADMKTSAGWKTVWAPSKISSYAPSTVMSAACSVSLLPYSGIAFMKPTLESSSTSRTQARTE